MSGRQFSPVVPIDQVPPAEKLEYRPVVLVVDDESAIADTLTEILSRSGYAAMPAYDGYGALETALVAPPEMLITDVVLPGMSGIELAITMRRIYPDCKVILFSGSATTAGLMNSARHDGHHFTLLTKPVHPRDLLAHVAECLKHETGQAKAVAV
jgi:DNA-binding NtrC family response regulator